MKPKTKKIPTPEPAPLFSPRPNSPAPRVRTASVGPGSTRSAAPDQAPYVPPQERAAPASSVGMGQARRK